MNVRVNGRIEVTLKALLGGLIALAGARPAGAAPSAECQRARDSLASLRERLAGEQRLLQGCQAHLGSCTPGNLQGIQEAIRGLSEEIDDETRAVRLACEPSGPPPRHDFVQIDDISPDAPYGQDSTGADTGGQIDAIAVDPTNDLVVYAGGETSGVWKSVDGGHNWAHASNGLGWGSTIDNGLAVDPTDPRRLLYATSSDDLGPGSRNGGWGGHSGLYVSLDAAANWSHVTIPGCVPDYARVQFGGSAAWAATSGCGIVTSATARLDSWQRVALPAGLTGVTDIAVGAGALHACVGNQVYRFGISRAAWDPTPITLPGTCVGLAAVPDDDTRFLAIILVPFTDASGNPRRRYQVGLGSSARAAFAQLSSLPAQTASGHPFVVAIKRPARTAGLGPGVGYTVLATNTKDLYEYQPTRSDTPARWNVIGRLHVDIHGAAGASPCRVYVANDGGVSTNGGGSGACFVSQSHMVRAMHGLHAYGTFGIAGAPGTSPVVYLPGNDNGIWGTSVSPSAATAWLDMGSDIGETGTTFYDPRSPGRFVAYRGDDLHFWASSDGTPPLPGSWTKIKICPPAASGAPTTCAADLVTQVLTLPAESPAANGDFIAIRHDPTTTSYGLVRNRSATTAGWASFGAPFSGRALQVQVSNGHAEPYAYVLAGDGQLYRGRVVRDRRSRTDRFTGWDVISSGVPRIANFSVDPYRPNIIYALVIGDPSSLGDDDIRVTLDATSARPTWFVDANLTRMATGGGRYRLACGDGAPGAPSGGTLNWGENHGYRYECALNQVVFVADHPEMRFAIMTTGVAFTRDSGATWRDLGGTSPLARPMAAFYDPTPVGTNGETTLYVGLRGHGAIRMRSRFAP
jgi:hypothetical protein